MAVQMGPTQVQIFGGGPNGGVPKQHLHAADVRAAFKHMGGEAMAEGVRVDPFGPLVRAD